MTTHANAPLDDAHAPRAKAYIACEALRTLPVALVIVLEDGFVLSANERACALLERRPAELEGAHLEVHIVAFDEILHPSSRSGEPPKARVTTGSGAKKVLAFSVANMPALSHIGGAVYAVTLTDVTASERIREERDRLLQIATVHEVLPAILHEIKNPLAAIATTAELLVEDGHCAAGREGARAILNEARRMRRLLQGIGAAGGRLRTPRAHAAVDHVLREVVRMLQAKAESEGVRLSFSVPNMPLLPLDTSVLAGIVHNLVTNAMQAASPRGEVRVTASLDEQRERLTLTVSDTGAGMSPDTIAECRKLFFTTKPKGTGVGLTLCDRALRAAGGTMHIESSPGEGTRISLLIPTTPLDEARSFATVE